MITFRTERLHLRMFRERDLDAYAAMCADAEVMQHIGAGGPVGRDVAWRQMALFLGEWTLHGHGMWAVERRADSRLIGRVGFLEPEGWPGCRREETDAADEPAHRPRRFPRARGLARLRTRLAAGP